MDCAPLRFLCPWILQVRILDIQPFSRSVYIHTYGGKIWKAMSIPHVHALVVVSVMYPSQLWHVLLLRLTSDIENLLWAGD